MFSKAWSPRRSLSGVPLEKSKQKRHGFHGFVKTFSITRWGRALQYNRIIRHAFGIREIRGVFCFFAQTALIGVSSYKLFIF
jgi:hypothetical protein